MKNLLSVCMFGGCTKGKGDQGMLQIPRSKEKMSDTKPIYLFPSPPQHTHTHTHIPRYSNKTQYARSQDRILLPTNFARHARDSGGRKQRNIGVRGRER